MSTLDDPRFYPTGSQPLPCQDEDSWSDIHRENTMALSMEIKRANFEGVQLRSVIGRGYIKYRIYFTGGILYGITFAVNSSGEIMTMLAHRFESPLNTSQVPSAYGNVCKTFPVSESFYRFLRMATILFRTGALEDPGKHESIGHNCPICLEELGKQTAHVLLPCRHVCHLLCFQRWVSVSRNVSKCPVCSGTVTSTVPLDSVDPNEVYTGGNPFKRLYLVTKKMYHYATSGGQV